MAISRQAGYQAERWISDILVTLDTLQTEGIPAREPSHQTEVGITQRSLARIAEVREELGQLATTTDL